MQPVAHRAARGQSGKATQAEATFSAFTTAITGISEVTGRASWKLLSTGFPAAAI